MLVSLPENQRNQSVILCEASQLYNNRFKMSSLPALYYPYNHDIKDQGWGCAWRAIQMLLSYKTISLSFQNLYTVYSKRQCLESIIQKINKFDQQSLNQLNKSKWIPEQLDNHWAQPFIASLICSFYEIPNTLLLLNGYPIANAPSVVFRNTITFKEMTELIKSNINHSSIMIDDGQYALSIIGFNQTHESVQLLFADPHVRSNRDNKAVGLYCKQFDLCGKSKGGDQRSEEQKVQSLYNVYQALQFETKFWMICFINA